MAQRKRRSRSVFARQVILLLFLVAVLVGLIVAEATRTTKAIVTEEVRVETVTEYRAAVGWLFSDQTALCSSNSGPVERLAREGKPLAAGTPIANVYEDDSGTGKRERAAVIQAEIEALQILLECDSEHWKENYLRAYSTLMRETGQNTKADSTATQALMAALGGKYLAGDAAREETILERIDALREEFQKLVRNVDTPQTISAGYDGCYFAYVDGYEALFGTQQAATVTPETLLQKLASPLFPEGAFAKLVHAGKVSFAVLQTKEEAADFRLDQTYLVQCTDVTLEMQLTRMTPSEDGACVLCLFEAESAPLGFDFSRRQELKIAIATHQGLRVPEGAVQEENGTYTVFILQNGVATKRAFTPLYRENGCLLAAETPTATSAFPPLAAGERVLLTARHMYEGKVLVKS